MTLFDTVTIVCTLIFVADFYTTPKVDVWHRISVGGLITYWALQALK